MRLYEGDPRRVATILPGRGYTPDGPLLHYTRRVLHDRGWTVREHWWERGAATTLDEARDEATDVVKGAHAHGLHLVVGKSLGSLAAPVVVDHGLPAIWLTPLLREDVVRAAILATLEPTLVVGGTGDASWDREVAAASHAQVHEVKGADHSLEIPGSSDDSVKILRRILRRIDDFVGGLEA
ncbi:hypothetical protein [Agilicoccus flavus]|uniref:hypothetical protein n=1 Tax=Agilicoccus flavus TaxID=2775968 RepID=UPI001CF60FEB|nr:hypothetical protein [Agilicoccus flavus]